jgi:hypothetical protein
MKNRKNLEDKDIGNYFLNRTPIDQEMRTEMDKWTASN